MVKAQEKVVEKTIEKEVVEKTEPIVGAIEPNNDEPKEESFETPSNQKQIEVVLESYNALKEKTESESLIIQYLECVIKEMTREIEVVDEEVVVAEEV